MTTTNKREKRYIADIGKDSDDLIGKLKLLSGNKKLTKQQTIYRTLEFCYNMKLNLSEVAEKPLTKKDIEKMKNEIIDKILFYNRDVDARIKYLEKYFKD